MKLLSTNPAKNYEVLGEVEVSTNEEIRRKVFKTNLTRENWRFLDVEQRAKFLKKIYNEFFKRKKELALLVTREMGMPITQSLMDIDSGLGYLKWYLENTERYLSPEITFEDEISIHTVYYEPIGTAAVILPWNFPFSNVIWGVVPNLIAGNAVVLKHSEECPLFGKQIEEIIINRCKLPESVFSEVYGDGAVGDYLIHQNIDLICFTGSTKVGRYLYEVAAKKFIKVLLELGGSAPGIVFEDAEINNNLETIYINRFLNCGQVCDALKRLIVHQNCFDEVVEKLKKLVESKKVGDPEKESTDIGPLVAKRQLELLELQVQDAVNKGAKIICGGKRPVGLKGAYYLPTILTQVTSKMRVWQEETFGPVLPIVTFKTEEEAIKLANDTKYGLGAYVFTEDKERALRVASKIQSGMVSVNKTSYVLPCNPFGGYRESGMGREHGKYGLRELCQIKVVSIEK